MKSVGYTSFRGRNTSIAPTTYMPVLCSGHTGAHVKGVCECLLDAKRALSLLRLFTGSFAGTGRALSGQPLFAGWPVGRGPPTVAQAAAREPTVALCALSERDCAAVLMDAKHKKAQLSWKQSTKRRFARSEGGSDSFHAPLPGRRLHEVCTQYANMPAEPLHSSRLKTNARQLCCCFVDVNASSGHVLPSASLGHQ